VTANALAAARLKTAYQSSPVAPLRDLIAPHDIENAYAIQQINTALWLNEGRRIVGRKVGLTAKAVRLQMGVDQPDFGVLFDDMIIADGGILSPKHTLQPKAEGEVAFIMASDLNDPDVTRTQVAAAVASVVTAIEIVDSRIEAWKITFADTVADNGSSAFFVLGSDPKPLDGLDLWTCGMALEVNGETVSIGAGAACMGHPLNALTWLAQTLAKRGDGLRKGDIVLSGALGPMFAIQPGDSVRATIGGLGSASFKYEKA
jgi:2-keto-4-pentenoate hydratase